MIIQLKIYKTRMNDCCNVLYETNQKNIICDNTQSERNISFITFKSLTQYNAISYILIIPLIIFP